MLFPIKSRHTPGLIHAETMSAMILGSPIFSRSRIFSRKIIFFAQWENEKNLDEFLRKHGRGKLIAQGWHIRLNFVRQWGAISGYQIPQQEIKLDEGQPVVAVTIARMKYSQIPRFLRWGRPVEMQVRDSEETTLSLASIRYPNVISTFSIWKSLKAMTDMAHGFSQQPHPRRHSSAMKERNRKDFHFEFTTLRFVPLSESGKWKDKTQYIPQHDWL